MLHPIQSKTRFRFHALSPIKMPDKLHKQIKGLCWLFIYLFILYVLAFVFNFSKQEKICQMMFVLIFSFQIIKIWHRKK
jgi:hypothetical protein